MNLVYSHGWEAEQGGELISSPGAVVYEELYDTAVWDKMLLVSAMARSSLPVYLL